ncbi:NTP transferase domain-containing protein [Amnibacterium sp. CER49]|uniref:molybdenum cofactor guanylyltransferase n=1 Tax=Amnibacterium sp. CER49 TaxID=3039161 RepID=UPI002448E500|nr:NTP transferase domain-containing protein [Amnibacterium sp. CER49]MDH2444599.1 NTP transferase domain-containing protein [Amnibacterium sp. CER49]
MIDWNAIVLTGGRASRLGGIDKCALEVRGRRLLDIALAATEHAAARVVVGPQREDLPAGVRAVQDTEPYAGTPSAVETGLAALAPWAAPMTAVVAADQPRADDALAVVLASVAPSTDAEAWVAVDPGGEPHALLAVYRTEALARAIAEARREAGTPGRKLRGILPRLAVQPVRLFGYLCADIDTPVDLVEHGIDPARVLPARV